MRVKLAAILCIAIILCGCKNSEDSLKEGMALRREILESSGCSFHSTVTADYGEKIYVFQMDCKTDKEGTLQFAVTSPDTISGITGKIDNDGGAITFDDKVLAFQTLADGQVTPVTAPWLMIKTLRSGYIRDAVATEEGFEVSIDDSYKEDALRLVIGVVGGKPATAEIYWQSRRILTVTVEDFVFL